MRPFRYELNQIPYDYRVEVRKRFKELDLTDGVPEERWTCSWHCTRGKDQDHPQEKEMQKAKWLSEDGLQTAMKRREVKGKGEKDTPIWVQSSKDSNER